MTAAKERWERIATDSREAACKATERMQKAYCLTGRSHGGHQADLALTEAREIANKLRVEDAFNAHLMCFPAAPTGIADDSPRLQIKVIPGDYVAVHADVLLGMEAELAGALSAMHRARCDMAEWMAGRQDEIANYLEYNETGLANVAAGRKWSDDE